MMTDKMGAAEAKTLETMRKLYKALQQEKRLRQDLERQITGPIAVVGMACRFPGGGNDPDLFWQNLMAGQDAISVVPKVRWDKDDPALYVDGKPLLATQNGGFIDDPLTAFDYDFFRLSPKEARSLDPQQRLLLEISWEALESAGIVPARLKGSRTGVFVGISGDDYMLAERHQSDLSRIGPYSITGNTPSTAAGRLAYYYGFEGPAMPVDTACSSSLTALHLACQSLNAGETDMVMAGGVNLILAPNVHACFSQLQAIAPDGRCKSFDAAANGYSRSEGCGMVVLKRLSDAEAAGDRILGVIDATVVNQDGASNGFTAPNGAAQKRLLLEGLSKAKLAPTDIDYIETHGTGTALGDPIEAEALSAVFGSGRDTPLVLGALKSHIGHLEAAAGIASVIKTLLAMQHKTIPKNLHFDHLNPLISWPDKTITVPTQPQIWPQNKMRRAGVSSFGFSGTNAHVILSQAPDTLMDIEASGPFFLTLSATTADTLAEAKRDMAMRLEQSRGNAREGHDICATLLHHRTHFAMRFACVADSVDDLITALSGTDLSSGMLTAAQQNWLATGAVDEALGYAVGTYSIVDLPTHRFDRKPCRLGPDDGPIIPVWRPLHRTSPIDLPDFLVEKSPTDWVFDLKHVLLGNLHDHVVLDTPVMPAAGFLACASVIPLFQHCDVIELTDVRFVEPLVLKDADSWLDLHAEQLEDGGYTLTFATSQKVVCRMEARAAASIDLPDSCLAADYSEAKPLSQEQFFGQHNGALTLGPAFRLAQDLRATDTQISGALIAEVASAHRWISPSHLDVSLQMAACLLPSVKGIALPAAINNVQINLAVLRRGVLPTSATAGRGFDGVSSAIFAGDEAIVALRQISGGETTAQALRQAFDEAQGIVFADLSWSATQPILAAATPSFAYYVPDIGTSATNAAIAALREAGITASIWTDLPDETTVDHLIYVDAIWPTDCSLEQRLTPLIGLSQELMARTDKPSLCVVTGSAFDPAQHNGEMVAEARGVWGFVRSVWQEDPSLTGALVDLDHTCWVSEISGAVDHIASATGTSQYAMRDSLVWEPMLVKRAAPQQVTTPEDGCVIITGGTGTLGQALARAKLRAGAKHVLLIGRGAAETDFSDWPGRVSFVQGDVSDAALWDHISDAVGGLGLPAPSLYHLAGVSGAGMVSALDVAEMRAKIAAKTLGTEHLLHFAKRHKAGCVVLVSSIAAQMGAMGQSLYAAANATMEAMGEKARHSGLPVSCIALGPLDGGLAANMDVQRHLAGVGLLAAPLRMFHAAAQADQTWLAAFKADTDVLSDASPFQGITTNSSRKVSTAVPQDPAELRDYLTNLCNSEAVKALGLDPNHQLDPQHVLFELGLDSLMALQIRNAAEAALDLSLSSTLVFENPSVAALVAVLEEQLLQSPEFPIDAEDGNALASSHQLSAAQESLWLRQQVSTGSAAYHTLFSAEIVSGYSFELLIKAFKTCIARHDCLQTMVRETPQTGLPYRHVGHADDFRLIKATLTCTSEADLRAEVKKISQQPFDLVHELPIRAHILRTPDGRNLLLVTAHHICIDVWSFELLLKDLGEALDGVTLGTARTYQAYVHYQNDLRTAPNSERYHAFWHDTLAKAKAPALPPLASATPEGSAMEGATMHVQVPDGLAPALEAYARKNGVTLYSLLTTVWALMCKRFDPDRFDDLIVGAPSHGRNDRRWSETLGFFVSVLPLKFSLDLEQPVGELLQQTNQRLIDAMAHQDVPFQDICSAAPQQARAGDYPLFNTIIHIRQLDTYEEAAGFFVPDTAGKMQLGPVMLAPFYVDQQEGQYPLVLEWSKFKQDMWLSLTYDTAFYNHPRASLVKDLYLQALQSIVSSEETLISGTLDLLPPPDMTTPRKDGIGPYLIDQVIADCAARHPDRASVIWGQGQSMTYAALDARANGMAQRLSTQGVGHGDRVGICMARSPQMIVTLLGILKLGASYVPLVKELPIDALLRQTQQAALRAIVHDPDAPSIVVAEAENALSITHLTDIESTNTPPETTRNADDVMYVLFTSGSTGVPKGVQISHRALSCRFASLESAGIHMGPERFMVATTFGFDPSVVELFYGLVSGGQAVILPQGDERDPRALIACIRNNAVTASCSVPSMIRQMLEEPNAAEDMKSLKIWYSGGDPMSFDLVKVFQSSGMQATLLNAYGPTETTLCTTSWPVRSDTQVAPDGVRIGRALPGETIRLLDDQLREVPLGAVGQIYVGGESLLTGYLNDPEKTSASLIADPRAPERQLYRTGDYAAWVPTELGMPELAFMGRGDFQVKVNGVRVELGDVEARLTDPADAFEICARLIEANSGAKQIVIAYASNDMAADQVEQILQVRASGSLQDAIQPHRFVQFEKLPLLLNGKLDLIAIDKRLFHTSRQPAQGNAAVQQGQTLALVKKVWGDVLNLETFASDQNFFELGGTSLLLAQVRRGLETGGITGLQIKDMFRHTTVRALAQFIDLKRGKTSALSAPLVATARRSSQEGIAVVGMTIRVPGAPDLAAFWDMVRNGESGLSRWSQEQLIAANVPPHLANDPAYVPVNGALRDVDMFDARFFGFSPAEAEQMDPQHRLFLQAAWHTLEHAGYADPHAGRRIGVFAGSELSNYLLFNLAHRLDPNEMNGGYALSLANDKDSLATRVAYACNLKGPAITVQTACSTSLTAVVQACEAIMAGKCEMALAGGVSINLPQDRGYLHRVGMVASRDGACLPFDAQASGTVNGNGLGLVLLKPLAQAKADGDTIQGVLRGWGINNDGSGKVGFTAPSEQAQADAIVQAWDMAGVQSEDVRFVETHGTGTINGDPIEMAGLEIAYKALRGGTAPASSVWLGAVKANIGHLGTASGIAGLIKTLLVAKSKTVPPLRGFSKLNPEIDLSASAFRVPTETMTIIDDKTPFVAGVSSFGIGGTNVHVVVEGGPNAAPPTNLQPERPVILPISANSAKSLQRLVLGLGDHLATTPNVQLSDIAFSLQQGRAALPFRHHIVAKDTKAAISALSGFSGSEVRVSDHQRVAGVLPGQGSQHPDMCLDLYQTNPQFRDDLDQRLHTLAKISGKGYEEWRAMILPTMTHPGDRDAVDTARKMLGQTANTQPVLYVLQTALLKMWHDAGVTFDTLVGHSIGEYAAACAAGVFGFEDGLRLVVARGQLIQSLPEGSMLAVAMPAADLLPLLPKGIDLAGDNGLSQCVVSAPDVMIKELTRMLERLATTVHQLDTSHAFHSSMMDPILDAFRAKVSVVDLQAPQLQVISCLTGVPLTADEATSPDYWVQQLRGTVQFRTAVNSIVQTDPAAVVEIGPGQSLSGQLKRLTAGHGITVYGSCGAKGHPAKDADVVAQTAAALWALGHTIDWSRVVRFDGPVGRVPLPLTSFDTERYWIDPQPTPQLRTATALSHAPQRFVPQWVPLGMMDGDLLDPPQVICVGDQQGVVALHDGDGPMLQYESVEEFLTDQVKSEAAPVVVLVKPTLVDFVRITQRLVVQNPNAHLLAVTVQGHAVGLEDIDPHASMITGAAAALRRECPGFDVKIVDVDNNVPAIGAVTLRAEVSQENALVAYRGTRRFVRQWAMQKRPVGKTMCKQGMRVLITGGLGGLGRACAARLTSEWDAQVTLIGRKATQDLTVEQRDWLAEHHTAVRYVQAGISDPLALKAAIDSMNEPIDLLLHCAGHVQDAALAELTEDNMQDVLRAKCEGTRTLNAVTEAIPPKMTVYFSSLSAVTGAERAIDYAAANAYLDADANAQVSAGRQVVSIGWDGWYETGMAAQGGLAVTDAVRAHALGTQEAVDALMQSLIPGGASHVLISKTSFEGYSETRYRPAITTRDEAPVAKHARPDLANVYVTPQTDTQRKLAVIWSAVLGIEGIGIDDNFFDIGGDSLIGAEVLNRVSAAFDKQLPAVAIYDAPNIRSMGTLLTEDGKEAPEPEVEPKRRSRRPKNLKDEL